MLLLTRARLINWHFFSDSIIELDQMSLISGDNGAGKSTIIDAIQYALVANIRKLRFNQAASDMKSGRSLESYCRCKIGAESMDFLRGDCFSHVILEFTGKSKRFCSGIMIESSADGSSPGELPWVMENVSLEDIPVFTEERYLSVSEFRQIIKNMDGIVCVTKSDYNSRLTHLLGVHKRNINFNPYLDAVVRSVNFTPFSSVDKFVCNYILDERQVEISAMRENLVHYREAEREAVRITERITQLGLIKTLCDDLEEVRKQIILQNMLLVKIDSDICRESIAEFENSYEKIKNQLDGEKRNIEFISEQISGRSSLLDGYKQSLMNNNAHAVYSALEQQLGILRDKIEIEKRNAEKHNLLKSQLEALAGRKLDGSYDNEIARFEKERDLCNIKIHTAGNEIQEIITMLGQLKQESEELKKGNLKYPENSVTLLKELKDRGIDAWIFSDLLDVNDESWQNAVEGWLNTQRFNILVNEKDYQNSVNIYNSLSKNIHSVGLPDLVKMKNSEITPGSLGEVVTSDSPLGKRYIASLLGGVMMTKIENIRDYKKSVTKECMRYSGYTASRISPEIYSRWYIGKSAKEKRSSDLIKLVSENESILAEKRKLTEEITQELDICKRGIDTLFELKLLSSAAERLSAAENDLIDIKNQLDKIDTSEFKAIQEQITKLTGELKNLDNEKEVSNKKTGRYESQIEELLLKIEDLKKREKYLQKNFEEFISDYIQYNDEFQIYYRERTRDKNFNDVKLNFERSKKGTETKFENLRSDLLKKKNEFNRTNNFYLSTDPDDNRPFIDLLEKYVNTELPQYHEKISRARSDAEKQFKEHFVTKLNEYIEEARESFKEINANLKNIMFGKDRYRFTIEERIENRKILSVIKTAAMITENSGTLWEHLTDNEDKEIVDRLFSKILENDIDSIEVKNLCDYREYFHYDIRINHTDTSFESSLSRVLKEKSGGETQTPYYVAIAASFFRFFKNEPDAIRLVLFDEAFSKMDDDRIGKTINFFRQMGIQIITAVPTEKIEPIVPFMDKTSIIIRKANSAYVRDYSILLGESPDAR